MLGACMRCWPFSDADDQRQAVPTQGAASLVTFTFAILSGILEQSVGEQSPAAEVRLVMSTSDLMQRNLI